MSSHGVGQLAAEPLRLPHRGGAHHEQQQRERDQEAEADQDDGDGAPAARATPHHADHRVEREREHDASRRCAATRRRRCSRGRPRGGRRAARRRPRAATPSRARASPVRGHARSTRAAVARSASQALRLQPARPSPGRLARAARRRGVRRPRQPPSVLYEAMAAPTGDQRGQPSGIRDLSRSLRVAIAFSSVVALLLVIVLTYAVRHVLSEARHTLALFVAAGISAILLAPLVELLPALDAPRRRGRCRRRLAHRSPRPRRVGRARRHQPSDRAPSGRRAEGGRADRAEPAVREGGARVPPRGARDRGGQQPQPEHHAAGAEGGPPCRDLHRGRHPHALPLVVGTADGQGCARADLG